MDSLQKILLGFEIHSSEIIREEFEKGISPNQDYNGKPLIYSLINMYYRSHKFSECMKVFKEFGWKEEDEILFIILLNDPKKLNLLVSQNPSLLNKTYDLDCTFTPLYKASLLHICAEYNMVEAAKILIKHGADVNVRAGIDENGFGGHSPIFHTVNQHNNHGIEMLNLLLQHNVDLDVKVKGMIWGKGYPWETYIPEVSPISYAMMGLLRQFQRTEKDIYEVVNILMKVKYDINYKHDNLPNKYLIS
ncbi:MAG: hypothetical protein RLZZ546_1815 [Bacteroidota bacterium]